MRILIVSQYFHPENFRVNQLATALRERGHDIVVLTGQPNYPGGRILPGYGSWRTRTDTWNGIEIIRVPIFARRAGRGWQLALNYLSFAISATLFGLPRARGTFDACVAFCPSPITIAIPAIVQRWFRKTPVAIWLQDLWPESVLAVTRSRSRMMKGALDAPGAMDLPARRPDLDSIAAPMPRASPRTAAVPSRSSMCPIGPRTSTTAADGPTLPASRFRPIRLSTPEISAESQGLDTIIDAADRARTVAPRSIGCWSATGCSATGCEPRCAAARSNKHVTIMPRREPQDMPAVLKSAAALLVMLADEPVFAQTIPSKLQSCFASGRPDHCVAGRRVGAHRRGGAMRDRLPAAGLRRAGERRSRDHRDAGGGPGQARAKCPRLLPDAFYAVPDHRHNFSASAAR